MVFVKATPSQMDCNFNTKEAKGFKRVLLNAYHVPSTVLELSLTYPMREALLAPYVDEEIGSEKLHNLLNSVLP